jgi:hypothetical protein
MDHYHPHTRQLDTSSAGRRWAGCSGAAALLVVLLCVAAAGPAGGDSLTFWAQGGGSYWYLAEADDFTWNVDDTITLTGMEQVAGVTTPAGFGAQYSPYSVIWSCTSDVGGPPFFGVQSAAPPGPIAYSIVSAHPAIDVPTTGPEYTPEPATVAMFCGGPLTLGAVGWRRRSAKRHQWPSLARQSPAGCFVLLLAGYTLPYNIIAAFRRLGG